VQYDLVVGVVSGAVVEFDGIGAAEACDGDNVIVDVVAVVGLDAAFGWGVGLGVGWMEDDDGWEW